MSPDSEAEKQIVGVYIHSILTVMVFSHQPSDIPVPTIPSLSNVDTQIDVRRKYPE